MTLPTYYRDVCAINATAIKAGAVSMRHMRHALTVGKEPSKAMNWGTTCHEFLLGKPPEFVVYPGRRAGKEWDAFQVANEGKRIIIESERQKLLDESGLVASILSNPLASPLFHGAEFEQEVYWMEEGIGQCKGLVDGYNADTRTLFDLKTCQSIDERSFTNASWRMGYHLQLSFYRRGLRAIGKPVDRVAILAVESDWPFDLAVYDLDSALIDYAEKECIRIARKYTACVAAGSFPGAHPYPHTLLQPEHADGLIQGLPDEELDPSEID